MDLFEDEAVNISISDSAEASNVTTDPTVSVSPSTVSVSTANPSTDQSVM